MLAAMPNNNEDHDHRCLSYTIEFEVCPGLGNVEEDIDMEWLREHLFLLDQALGGLAGVILVNSTLQELVEGTDYTTIPATCQSDDDFESIRDVLTDMSSKLRDPRIVAWLKRMS